MAFRRLVDGLAEERSFGGDCRNVEEGIPVAFDLDPQRPENVLVEPCSFRIHGPLELVECWALDYQCTFLAASSAEAFLGTLNSAAV